MATKKLIEVALPLEKINAEAEKEKQIRHGHPSNLHQYWARRPFTTARAVIWASLVDDPSSHPDRFPSEEEQANERLRLFRILEDLVEWENSNNSDVIQAAVDEILKSTDGLPPALLDPFAGGGAIPYEAQKLGLESYAHDLNPVAVMINKAMIEIPALFSGKRPVNPDAQSLFATSSSGLQGMASDVQYYAEWIKNQAYQKVGHLYPMIDVPKKLGGGKSAVISWLWARTVKCPNPGCGCEVPLAKTFDISTKKGNLHSVGIDYDGNTPVFSVSQGKAKISGTVSRSGGVCLKCGALLDFPYIRTEASNGRMGTRLMAIAGEAPKGRIYVSPNSEHIMAAQVNRPDEYPDGAMAYNPRNFNTPNYGIDHFADLYTNRQLITLTTFASLVKEAQEKAEQDAIKAGMDNDHISLEDGGTGAKAYSQAIGVHLAFILDKMTCLHSNITMWKPLAQCPLSFFGRQAIPMSWDFAEANPFSNSSGSFMTIVDGYIKALSASFETSINVAGHAVQFDAQQDCGLRNIMISTDPPYYDNITYADLSDYFYVWLRYILRDTYPKTFGTLLVPKNEELVATPYRFEGDTDKAKQFFENGMAEACHQMYLYARDDVPVTIYYAYKQSEVNENDGLTQSASTGWETMLSAIINAGFAITGTWPMRTERASRVIGIGSNALASSIVLVCRKRSQEAPVCTRRNFINELKRELRPALQKLQSSNIAPVDLAQSAIGPGMGVYSKYSKVLEADGTPMTVRSALKVINQELDLYFNEQDSDLDSESRFCVELYSQFAFNEMPFGDANTLATAKNTSVAIMASHGILYAQKGKVHLLERAELPEKIDEHEGGIWLLCQQLTFKMEKEGVEGCASVVANMFGSNAERAKDLAYRLYTIAER